MTVESLKSELQQVLDNDLILRKEFNELKRSLSDYRNQLIMRDEDCKRLQVTIDVLNTKLVVMERDNNNYKAELTSFKELRSTIKDQLQEKQEEIDNRLNEIQSLKDELSALAAGYEARIEEIKLEATNELNSAKDDFNSQLGELKAVSAYKEQSIREEYELRINDLSTTIANKEQNFEINFQEQIAGLTSKHETELQNLKSNYELKLNSLSSGSREEIDSLISTNQQTIGELQTRFENEKQLLESNYVGEIGHLKSALEEQRQTLTNNFNHQIEAQKQEFESREEKLIGNYEGQINALSTQLSSSTSHLSEDFQKQIADLTLSHQNLINETNLSHESKVAGIISEYEEKLSVTLIHSNSQNSKLNDELAKAGLQNESSIQQIQELTSSIELKNAEITSLGTQISDLENLLNLETTKFNTINSEFEDFKIKASMSSTEQVNELNGQIAHLNEAHELLVNDLNLQIEKQNSEIANLVLVLETTTNQMSLNEGTAEEKSAELNAAYQKLNELEGLLLSNQLEFDNQISTLVENNNKELEAKQLEFDKLLAENSNLISEIETAQLTVESQEAELVLLRSELEEIKLISSNKSEDYKEIINNKNFEITNLEADRAALSQELIHAKMEVLNLENQLQNTSQSNETIEELTAQLNSLSIEKEGLVLELGAINNSVKELNTYISELNSKIQSYETEIEKIKTQASTEEQDLFIDRLFKQIDGLNDERLVLLEEKEQMANQLLKMNDVISNISQEVDKEKINVTDLNNHRKNVILASNSNDHKERSEMKEQINDLVREIDKCIALLSA